MLASHASLGSVGVKVLILKDTVWGHSMSTFELEAMFATQLLWDPHTERPVSKQKNRACGQG